MVEAALKGLLAVLKASSESPQSYIEACEAAGVLAIVGTSFARPHAPSRPFAPASPVSF